jgi:hypothetical protein
MMEASEIAGPFAREAVEAAVANREEVVPELLRILGEIVGRAEQLDDEGDGMAHIYAMFCWRSFVRFALILLWFGWRLFPVKSWIPCAGTSSPKTSARSWRQSAAAT